MDTRSPENKPKSEKSNQFPVLIAQQGPLEGQRWNISRELNIGRSPDCEVLINDRQVSRYHARITQTNNWVELEDLESKNGTFIHGAPLSGKVMLTDGEIFQVAMVQKFVFYATDATMPLDDVSALVMAKGDGLLVDKKSRRVWLGAKELLPPLSVPQFRLLEVLCEHPDLVVTRDELINMIWENEQASGVSDQALDALIRRLRNRLAEVDPEHNYIVTVRGHGLRLENK